MILIIIFIFMILLGFALTVVPKSDEWADDTNGFGAVMVVFGVAFLIISLIVIISGYALVNYTIQRNEIEYEGLCKRYEIVKSDYEDVSKSDVISDITEWNDKVYRTKYWTENPWTNWFNPKKIADNLNYIPLDEESEVPER